MTRDEFNDWLEYHCGAFRSIGEWFGRLSAEEAEKTLGHWFRVLRSVGLDEAKRATERLFNGDEAEPKSRDRIPAAIRAIAKKLRGDSPARRERRQVYVDGEPVFQCLLCEDDGRISVQVEANEDEPFPDRKYWTTYACHCRHGAFWLRQGFVRAPVGAKPFGVGTATHARPHRDEPARLGESIGVMPKD